MENEITTNNPWTCNTVRGMCTCENCRGYRTALRNEIGLRNAEQRKAQEYEARLRVGC